MNTFEIRTKKKTMTRKKFEEFSAQVRELAERYGLIVELREPVRGGSRDARLAAEMAVVEDAKSAVEELRDELQDWHDNLPENLQSGQKADELQEAIDALEEVSGSFEEATSNAGNVSFPGMY